MEHYERPCPNRSRIWGVVLSALLLLGLALFCVLPARADINFTPQKAASIVTPGTTTTTGCTSQFLVADASSKLNCSPAFVADSSGASAAVFTFRRTSLAAVTDNTGFFNFQGALTTPTSGGVINGFAFWVVGAGSGAVVQRNSDFRLQAGYTGVAATVAASFQNQSAGTGTDHVAGYTSTTNGGNWGVLARANATTTGSNTGILSDARGGDINVAGMFQAITNKSNATNVAVMGLAAQTTGTPVPVAGYFGLRTTAPTLISSVVQLDNLAIAVPIIVAQDAGAALPTTGATATWQIADGAWPVVGNGVLTSATMTAETQARECGGGLCHSYTWTNAMVAALSGTAGDITVATLPAKTVVSNAYVVITGAAVGPATVTVSCGDAIGATPFINWIVPSDAKAAANTVYGDTSGERGTSIDTEFYYLPSYTATTLVTCHFISTVANLSTTTGSTGRVIIQTSLLP